MVRGSHCHMISCVPPSTTISSLHFSIRIHDLKGVPLLATAFVCFEKGIACEEVPSLHTCLSNLFAIVTHGSVQSACFESCTCVRAYPGGQWPLACSCYRAFLSSVMPSRWLSQALQQNANAHSIPKIYTFHIYTHIFPTTPGWRHGTSNPRPCGTKRSHEATASRMGPKKTQASLLNIQFPLKKQLRYNYEDHLFVRIYIVLYLHVPQISDVWGKTFKAPGNQLHSFNFSLSRANEGRSRGKNKLSHPAKVFFQSESHMYHMANCTKNRTALQSQHISLMFDTLYILYIVLLEKCNLLRCQWEPTRGHCWDPPTASAAVRSCSPATGEGNTLASWCEIRCRNQKNQTAKYAKTCLSRSYMQNL